VYKYVLNQADLLFEVIGYVFVLCTLSIFIRYVNYSLSQFCGRHHTFMCCFSMYLYCCTPLETEKILRMPLSCNLLKV